MAGLDRDELAAIPPEDVTAYLAAHGWRRAGMRGQAEIWSVTVSGVEVDVLIPVNAGLRDYPVRVAEVVGTLAEVEERPRDEVLHDLRDVRVDVLAVSLSAGGNVPLHEGFRAVRGVHDLLLAAAAAVTLGSTPPVLPAQRPPEAWRFLHEVRLGQAGGATLRVEIPVSSRDVLVHLHDAVRTAHAVAEAGTVFDFEGHVTANLCRALADIGGTRHTPFEIAFTWAPTAPLETAPLRFDRHRITRLKEAGEHLRGVRSTEDARVEGLVVELRREAKDTDGTVVIDGTVSSADREWRDHVSVRLPPHEYETAIRAHRTAATVVAGGRLVRSGNRLDLTETERITVEQR